MHRKSCGVSLVVLALCFFLAASLASGQTITGRISGTVNDQSGAAVPGATVTLIHDATQLTRTFTTDRIGYFVATNLQVGAYTVKVDARGFKPQARTGNELVADGRLTVDFVVTVGDMSASVEVTEAVGETVNTVSGEIARVVDSKQVQDLALNGRNYMQLVSLIPGAALTNANQLDLMTSLSVTQQNVNGNRSNTNNLTVDGGSNLDSGSNGSQINNIGIDFIREVKIQTSNFSAEYGRQSGASINVVTRSGSNDLHGTVFEYFRNEKLDAREFFAPRRGKLRFNDYGWSLGGPIRRDKLFFFAGQEWKKIRRDTTATPRSIPTRAERRGDFTQGRSGVVLKYPGTSNAIPGQNISSMITADGRALAKVYDEMEKLASSYTDTPTGNNAIYQLANPFDVRQDMLRLDYTINEKHNLYGRYLHDEYELTEPLGTFSGSNLPTTPTIRRRPGTSYQGAHTWIMTPSLINEAKVNAAWNGQRIPPIGENWKRSTYGFQFPQIFGGGWWPEGIPNVDIQNFANFRGPAFALMSPTTDISANESITWLKGSHTLRAGFMVIRNRKDQNGRPDYLGYLNFTNQTTMTTSFAFADALLGNFRTYREAESDPVGFFRFTQYEGFVSDSWHAMKNLSFEIGVRWQYGTPIYTQQNNIVNFDPSLYKAAQAVTITRNGLIVPNSGNLYNGLIRAGDGVPEDQVGRVAAAKDPRLNLVPTGAPRGLYDAQNAFAPRFGFAYTPRGDNKTAIRGGFGIFYDRPEGNLIFSSVNLPPFSNVVQYENGNLANPGGGAAAALAPWGNIDTIDPALQAPMSMNYSLSVQRELPSGFFVEGAYVGNLGRHLIYQPDINQIDFDVNAANSALPSAERANPAFLRPYRGYSSIRQRQSSSISNYHGMQWQVTKRKGDLTLNSAYTWSKVLTDAQSNGDAGEDAWNRTYNYGPAEFDRRHVLVVNGTYDIPMFKEAQGVTHAVLGGWEISGIGRAQSGRLWTVNADTATGGRRADYIGGEVVIDNPTADRWFNTAVFRPAPESRRGTSGVGNVGGPGMLMFDFSARKNFRVTERIGVKFQADLFNAFNRANFRDIERNYSNQNFGKVTSTEPGRNIQFGMRLTF